MLRVKICLLLTMFLYMGFAACRSHEPGDSRLLAKVGNHELTLKHVQKLLPESLSPQDSQATVERIVKNWIEEQILLQEASIKLKRNEINIEREIESYKNSLIIHELEKKIIGAAPVYNPTVSEIKDYYQKNRKEFELKKNILRLNYIKIRQNSPGVDKARQWFFSDISTDKRRIMDYSRLLADNYFFDDKIWLTAEDIQKEIPVWSINPEDYARNQSKTILQDATYFYFINLIDFRISTESAPFDMVFQEIKDILINKKRVQIVEEYKSKVIRNAYQDKNAIKYP